MSLVADPVRLTFDDVERLGRGGKGHIDRIYLHWTAGHYFHVYDEYHLCIDRYGNIFAPPDGTGDDALTIRREHTWHRNTGSVGIALCCAYGAIASSGTELDFGPEPPTPMQMEILAKVVAVLCAALELGISPRTVLTHCEVAVKDGYGPGSGDPETRIDLMLLEDRPYHRELYPGGEVLRGKAEWYRQGARVRQLPIQALAGDDGQGEEVNEEWQSTKTLLNAA